MVDSSQIPARRSPPRTRRPRKLPLTNVLFIPRHGSCTPHSTNFITRVFPLRFYHPPSFTLSLSLFLSHSLSFFPCALSLSLLPSLPPSLPPAFSPRDHSLNIAFSLQRTPFRYARVCARINVSRREKRRETLVYDERIVSSSLSRARPLVSLPFPLSLSFTVSLSSLGIAVHPHGVHIRY